MTTTHGFELIREQEIPELKARAQIYRHVQTEAELLSLSNDDENKCFGAAFRTPPADSTGVAHILEHAVLCGSRKYPLKDPFVELLKGSLQTFLNAFTFPDKTCYPVASANLQDFYNLVDVYLDTVFHPRLARETFLQQGWHYEMERPDEPLIYKGVVFNEMKGAYSSPDAILGKHSQQSLFPDNTYGVDSGGDPRQIPDLTHEQLIGFHRTYYHPSNARIFFYGDDPVEERLRILDGYLQDFERQEVASSVSLQPRFSVPRSVQAFYASDAESDGAKRAMVSLNWMLAENTDTETTLALSILSHALTGTPASPLRKALIDSGLGEALTASGVDDDLRQITFRVGLKGIAIQDAPKVEALILDTLQSLAETGIDRETLEASLNTVEFRLREQNTGGFPRGLALMLGALTTWLHDGDPLAPLAFEAPLARIKERALSGRYLENLIKQMLLDNPHRTTVTTQPDPELAARQQEAEELRLAEARAAMGEADLQRVMEETRQLKLRQETPDPPEALAAVPMLQLSDLDPKIKTIPLAEEELTGAKVLFHDLFTSGIVYLDFGFDLHGLPQELLPYVPLFGRSLLQLGTEQENFVRLTQRIGQKTGGIWNQSLNSTVRDRPEAASWLFLRGKATVAQTGDLLGILRDILLTARLDNQERFRQLALEERARLEASLVPGGSGYVAQRLGARFTEAGWVSEQMGGVSYLFFLRDLVGRIDSDWHGVLAALEQIRQAALHRGGLIGNATVDADGWQEVRPRVEEFLAQLPARPASSTQWTWQPEQAHEGLTIPAQVNYVGKGADLYHLGYAEDGAASVISKYLATSWLWQQVRVQGGAYGGFCSFDSLSGVFSYLSYRDPNLLSTLDVYDRTGQFLREQALDETELTRSIVGAIGATDRYQLPDAKGFTSLARHLIGETDESRQRRRDEMLSTNAADFRAFADVLDEVREQGQIVVMGAPDAVRSANEERPRLLEVKKVL
ncbi:MAG: insulinase family protein [Armatimonadetes bacterium]|nr:insulinase family protein [Armatimonadota bacterium]